MTTGAGDDGIKTDSDKDYFVSYEDLDIHELMLRDVPRTQAYQRFIEDNKELFSDKIVVDVGAGTGILSLFAARAGAKQVFAIEASGMSQICEAIVQQNGLEDIITVIHGKAEEIDLPGGIKADILVSEWMGFYLLHESMLHSVVVARERFLKPEGVILPSSASLYLCPVSTTQFHKDKFHFWNKLYGFDFSPVVSYVQQKTQSEPQILTLKPDQCLGEPELVVNLDLKYVELDDIRKIASHFNFKLNKNGVLHGFACWFDVEFEGEKVNILSTGPEAEPTHWKQTVIMLPDALLVSRDEEIRCNVCLEQSKDNPRRYNICIEVPEEEEMEGSENGEVTDMIVAAMDPNN